jgi:hypothetical protein
VQVVRDEQHVCGDDHSMRRNLVHDRPCRSCLHCAVWERLSGVLAGLHLHEPWFLPSHLLQRHKWLGVRLVLLVQLLHRKQPLRAASPSRSGCVLLSVVIDLHQLQPLHLVRHLLLSRH